MDGVEEYDQTESEEEALDVRTKTVECDLELKKRLVDAAAAAGNIECLQLLETQGYPRDASACAAAAEHGQLAALKFLHERGWPWSTKVLYHAIVNNDRGVYRYAFENDCEEHWEWGVGGGDGGEYPGSSQIEDAALHGNLDVLKLIVNICGTALICTDHYTNACSSGSLRCLEYMDKESKREAQKRAAGQWGAEHETLDDFCTMGACHLDDTDDPCLAYIHESGAAWDRSRQDWRAAVRRVVYWPKLRAHARLSALVALAVRFLSEEAHKPKYLATRVADWEAEPSSGSEVLLPKCSREEYEARAAGTSASFSASP